MNILKKIASLFWNRTENRLRAFWRIGLHTNLVLLFTGLIILLLLLILFVIGNLFGTMPDGMGLFQLLELPWVITVLTPAATFAGILLATYLAGRWIDRRKFQKFGLNNNKTWWADLGFGLALGALLMGVIFLVGWLSGNVMITGFFHSTSEDIHFLTGFLQALLLFLFVGIYEEILSRGYHLVNLAEGFNHPKVGNTWALILAYLVSSLVFGALHLGNPNATLVSTLNISLAGLFLGLGMVLTGSLAIPIGIHITWNFFQGNVFGFPVSGIQPGATVIATETVGAEWLMGGAFGPESGVIGLAGILLGSLLTLLWISKKGKLGLKTLLASYQPKSKKSIKDTADTKIH